MLPILKVATIDICYVVRIASMLGTYFASLVLNNNRRWMLLPSVKLANLQAHVIPEIVPTGCKMVLLMEPLSCVFNEVLA
jgi:hypothetical protein